MFLAYEVNEVIGNSTVMAKAWSCVKAGGVSQVTVRKKNGLQYFRGAVLMGMEVNFASFDYDEDEEVLYDCGCTCTEIRRSPRGCCHVAALMLAVSLDMAKKDETQVGTDIIDTILKRRRDRSARHIASQEPVRLYVTLRRTAIDELALTLKLGRTRPYVVRSMSELAYRAANRLQVTYGKELTFSHGEEELDERDAALYGQIVMLGGSSSIAYGNELRLTDVLLDQTMRLMEGHEVEILASGGETRRVKVIRGDIELPVELAEEKGHMVLKVSPENIVLGVNGAYCLRPDALVCAYGEAFTRIADLLEIARKAPSGIRFDSERLEEVCTRLLLPAKSSVVMRSGQALLAANTPTPMVPRFYVDADEAAGIICRVAFDYCGTELTARQKQTAIRRDRALEEDAHAAAKLLFPQQRGEDTYAFEGDDDACFALLSGRLQELERMGEVHISRQLAGMNVKHTQSMTFGLSCQGEKLVLLADLGGYTQEELNQALTAYREKRVYVRLKRGIFLSEAALEQAAEAAQVLEGLDVSAEAAQQGVELPMNRAMYLDAALKKRENLSLQAPREIAEWTQRMEAAQKTRAQQPSALNGQLRSYQLEGLSWLGALGDAGFGGILADDMGLGKTIQVLSMLLREQELGRPVRALVVCPASLQLNWLAEAKRFAPSLTCESLLGTAKARAQQIDRADAPNILMTSYDQLKRDVRRYEGVAFTHVLLDEAQSIKNAASQAAKAVKTLRAQHRFAMTGTPIENRLSELWSIFDFLMPGYLGTYRRFKERFEAPVVRNADERARENLHLMIAPFVLRRMKQDVLTDLPEKVETVMYSEMTAEQRKLYIAYAARLQKESEGGLQAGADRMKILAGLTRLRQICCDPRLCLEDYQGGSGKLEQLLEVVQDALAGGHRILLFSQFTSMLALIGDMLKGAGIDHYTLTGETDKQERMELVERFNAGGVDVFLISLKAGGTGLNLTGADVVIHYDPWWNIAAQNQATDRAHRIGQTRGVQVVKLIASDTVEDRILRLQEQKKVLGDGVLLGDENFFTMDADLLREVLGG